MRLLIIVVTCVLALSSRSALAGGDADSAAVTCMPDSQAVYGNYYLTTSGTIKHAAGSNALIRLYCQIPHTLSSPSHLWLLYSRNSSTCNISIAYRKVSKT